jgi:hypothetical protein
MLLSEFCMKVKLITLIKKTLQRGFVLKIYFKINFYKRHLPFDYNINHQHAK